jgi:hypothetical protein
VVSIAARTINQVIATQNTEITSLASGRLNHHISNWINHHKILVSSVAIGSRLKFAIIVTKTVDILTAKQIIAGEKIIGIKFFTLKYSKKSHLNILSHISLNAEARTIKGDKIIAIQSTQILIINTIETTINGIHIAKTYQNDMAVFNKSAKIHVSLSVIIHFHWFIKDVYSAVHTPTYELPSMMSCSLLVAHQVQVHLLFTSIPHIFSSLYTPVHKPKTVLHSV